MATIDVEALRGLVNATVTAVSILGGAMACASGYAASHEASRNASAERLAEQVNRSLAVGFNYGVPTAAIVFIIAV